MFPGKSTEVEEDKKEQDLESEWESRRSKFYNVGYKDGLEEGKSATLQQGFDEGYRQSTAAGYSEGLKKGKQATLDACTQLLKKG
ncbi:hypothetical protein WJX75_008825 [Coccomyxa subellipsoidea]|uniref:Essential protein Yae1 N-terminal domain-containing protein n=1 Tax=Coccomyxa subellipsoidea TaxID=248742 RepID=A0ABR2Z1M9_9CHLO